MKKVAPLFVISAGILWGMIGLFVRRLNEVGFSSMEITAIRSIATSIMMFLFLLIFQRKMLRIHWKDLWCFLGTGIVSIVIFNICYFQAIALTSLSVAAVLLYTAPVFVMIFSAILFLERINLIKMISICFTVIGCVLVTDLIGGNVGNIPIIGIVTGLGAGIGYALYSIFSRFALERGYHTFTIIFYTFVFASVGTIPMANMRGIVNQCAKQPSLLAFCVLFGLFSTVLPYIFYTLGLKDMENSQASIIASIEPVTATILGWLLFGEVLQLQNLIGMFFVLGAIVMSNINLNPKGKFGKNVEKSERT